MKCSNFYPFKSIWFKPGEFCLIHLASITHEICKSILRRSWDWGCFPGHLESIWQSLGRRYNFQITSKRNIREFTQALAQFLKWENTTRSCQWSSLRMGNLHCWSTSRFYSCSMIVYNPYKWSLWRTFY